MALRAAESDEDALSDERGINNLGRVFNGVYMALRAAESDEDALSDERGINNLGRVFNGAVSRESTTSYGHSTKTVEACLDPTTDCESLGDQDLLHKSVRHGDL
jgi:hypothetical protein